MALVTRFAAGKPFIAALAFVLSCLAIPAFAQPTPGITAARFALTIDGHEIASFSELSGIASQVDPVTKTVVLKRAMTRNIEMAAWHELVILGDVAAARKSCSLVMYNSAGAPVARYHLTNAWPSRIEISSLKAGASEVLMETVTMTAEFIQRISI